MSDVANINKSGWCAFCCSNFCYCSKESLMRQLRHTLDAIKDRNETLDKERERNRGLVEAVKLAQSRFATAKSYDQYYFYMTEALKKYGGGENE